MKTMIRGFHQDSEGDWVAELACGHTQHVRHRPPFQMRPWTQTSEGRGEHLGTEIECSMCEMPALPVHVHRYKRTDTFTEGTIPDGLRKHHKTKPGVWAKIVVEAGELEYRLEAPPREFLLTTDRSGVVPPGAPHRVAPVGAVRFHVEFFK